MSNELKSPKRCTIEMADLDDEMIIHDDPKGQWIFDPDHQAILFPEYPPKAREVNRESTPNPKRVNVISLYPQYDSVVEKLVFVEANLEGQYILDPDHTIKDLP